MRKAGEKKGEYEHENEHRQNKFFCHRKPKLLLFTSTVKLDKCVIMATWVSKVAAEETHNTRRH